MHGWHGWMLGGLGAAVFPSRARDGAVVPSVVDERARWRVAAGVSPKAAA